MSMLRPAWYGLFVLALLVSASAPRVAVATDELEFVPHPEEQISMERDMARARFEVSQADVKDLARRRLEAIRNAYRARHMDYLAGRGTYDSLLELLNLDILARQPLRTKADLNRDALEKLWRFHWQSETIVRQRYQSNQVKAADYYQTVYLLLDAEVNLALSRPKKK